MDKNLQENVQKIKFLKICCTHGRGYMLKMQPVWMVGWGLWCADV